jgi:hypothetical protein
MLDRIARAFAQVARIAQQLDVQDVVRAAA